MLLTSQMPFITLLDFSQEIQEYKEKIHKDLVKQDCQAKYTQMDSSSIKKISIASRSKALEKKNICLGKGSKTDKKNQNPQEWELGVNKCDGGVSGRSCDRKHSLGRKAVKCGRIHDVQKRSRKAAAVMQYGDEEMAGVIRSFRIVSNDDGSRYDVIERK